MQTLRRDSLVSTYSPDNLPRLRVRPGESFIVETHDRFARWLDATTPPDLSAPELMGVTGAVYVEGAMPGDLLAVDILDIRFTSKYGWVNAIPGKGVFSELVTSFSTRRVEIGPDGIDFEGLKVPLRPMIGRLGVAPKEASVPSVVPGPHGGNIDAIEATTGSTVYYPVFVEGGLICAGDVHAAMGDGESMISGVETMADLTLRARIIRGPGLAAKLGIETPLIQTEGHLIALGSAPSLEEGARLALSTLHRLLVTLRGFDPIAAGMALSLVCDLGIAQIVNPWPTAKAKIARQHLEIE